MSTKYPSQMKDKFNLRFPDGMRDLIETVAKKSGRSMNSEIIHRLNVSLSGVDMPPVQESLYIDIGPSVIKVDPADQTSVINAIVTLSALLQRVPD